VRDQFRVSVGYPEAEPCSRSLGYWPIAQKVTLAYLPHRLVRFLEFERLILYRFLRQVVAHNY